MKNILFIDLATKSGFAVYNEESQKIVKFGSVKFKGSCHGSKLDSCREWLDRITTEFNAAVVIVEDVYIPLDKERKSTSAFKLLSEYHGIGELFCCYCSLEYCVIEASAHHQTLLGWQSKKWARKQIKEETMKRAKVMGYDVCSDDEADAISLVRYWCHRYKKPLIAPNGHTYERS